MTFFVIVLGVKMLLALMSVSKKHHTFIFICIHVLCTMLYSSGGSWCNMTIKHMEICQFIVRNEFDHYIWKMYRLLYSLQCNITRRKATKTLYFLIEFEFRNMDLSTRDFCVTLVISKSQSLHFVKIQFSQIFPTLIILLSHKSKYLSRLALWDGIKSILKVCSEDLS